MRKLIIAVAVLLLTAAPGLLLAQQWCPSLKHDTASNGQTEICTNPLSVAAADGGGILQICPQYKLIKYSQSTTCPDVWFTDLKVIHVPTPGDTNPYYQYQYHVNQTSKQFGYFSNGTFYFTNGWAQGIVCPFGGC